MFPRFRYLLLIVATLAPAVASAQDATEKERNERMQVMRDLADQIKVYAGDQQREIERIEKHLMRHNDATRNYQDGSIWAFGPQGRPATIMMIQTNDASTGGWWYAATHISGGPLQMQHRSQVVWSPTAAGVSMKPLNSDAAPAKSRGLRLIQMRNLADRFTAHQFWDPDNQRYQLRLLRQPIYRYADEKAGIIDGAVFSFVINVHPELLLLIEAHEGDNGPAFQYAFAKLGSAEFHGQLDGEAVYSSPRAPGTVGTVDGSYRLFSTSVPVK